jgi:fructokinase
MSSPDILVAGETLIDFLPGSSGGLATVESFDRRAGGAPANVAVTLAQLDSTPWFWTRIGTDPFGEFLVETLQSHDLPERFIECDPDARTSLAFVSHDADADREFSFYREQTADTRMQPGTVTDDELDDVEWVYVGGVTLTDEPSREATFDLARRASERGCAVLFDPNARPELWDEFDFESSVREMLSYADLVKATPEDLSAAGFEGSSPDALAGQVCEAGPHTTLLTLGSDGAYVLSTEDAPWESTTMSHDGFEVDPVDATGAGDAFTAGALDAFSRGKEPAEVLEFANAVAAMTTLEAGAMEAVVTREDVDAFCE